MTGYEKWTAMGNAMRVGKPIARPVPAKDYSSCTLADLHVLEDKATDWLKVNIDNPMFEEANKRYMEIMDTIQLKEAESIFGEEK